MKDKKQIIDSIKPLVDRIMKAGQIMDILDGTELRDATIILGSVIYQIATNTDIDVFEIYEEMMTATMHVINKVE